MNIQIVDSNKNLDLPLDFEVETTVTNPLFNDEGSQSPSVALPPTSNNFSQLGHPERHDLSKKMIDRRVAVEHGIYRQYGKMVVVDAEKTQGINTSIIYDEAEFWNKVNDTDISKLNWETINFGSVTAAITACEGWMNNPDSGDFCVFPVILEKYEKDDKVGYYAVNLNYSGSNQLEARLVRKENIKSGSKWAEITNPVGYAVTPFIKLHVFLQKLFTLLGFQLDEQPFTENPQLKRLCLLNNTRDTIVAGKIDMASIVPNCTVNELIDTLQAKGVQVFFKSETQTVSLKFIKEVITADPATDLSEFRSSPYKNKYSKQKQLKLSSAKSIEYAETDGETFSEFKKKYGTEFIYKKVQQQMQSNNISSLKYFVQNNQNFYIINRNDNNVVESNFISSMFFNYDKKHDDLEYLSLEGKDEQVPVILHQNTLTPYFLVGARNYNTDLTVKNQAVLEDKENKNPIAFCFGYTRFGSPFSYDKNGNDIYIGTHKCDIDYCYDGERGIFNRWFKEFEQILLHSLQEVEVDFRLSEKEFYNLKIDRPILSDNQKYLISKYVRKIGKKLATNFLLLTLLLKEPISGDSDNPIEFSGYKYVFFNRFEETADEFGNDNVPETEEEDDVEVLAVWEYRGYDREDYFYVTVEYEYEFIESNAIEKPEFDEDMLSTLPKPTEDMLDEEFLVKDYAAVVSYVGYPTVVGGYYENPEGGMSYIDDSYLAKDLPRRTLDLEFTYQAGVRVTEY
jgi:hypothetical protein